MEQTDLVETLIYGRPESLGTGITHYCPGCTHGVAHRLVAEVIDELGVRERTIGVAPVGCAVFAYNYFEMDFAVAAHGRAPAMATGIKRVSPDRVVFTYQGDGDLASIGAAGILHAAARGENITVIFINNAIYGMTAEWPPAAHHLVPLGGTRRPGSRCAWRKLVGVDGSARSAAVHSVGEIRKAKKAIRQAFEVQLQGLGFSMVELLSSCPTNWGIPPEESLAWIEEHMIPVFPLGDYKVHSAIAVKTEGR
jgi:2-oxoglutarate ferredoxin oxidoreductase subunit beta